MSILEAGMMFCFGASWPFQVAKTFKTKNVKGKSILFLWLVEIGYVLGIAHKIFYNMDSVIYLYILNLLLVGSDMFLYYLYRNRPENKTNLRLLRPENSHVSNPNQANEPVS